MPDRVHMMISIPPALPEDGYCARQIPSLRKSTRCSASQSVPALTSMPQGRCATRTEPPTLIECASRAAPHPG